jgi:hypothetical protein
MREFYEVRSDKAKEWEGGLRKVSFASNEPSAHAFVWLTEQDEIHSIQILLGETVVEWNTENGVTRSDTNRLHAPQMQHDPEKGSRSLHNMQENLSDIERNQLRNSLFPAKWDTPIKSRFHVLEPKN